MYTILELGMGESKEGKADVEKSGRERYEERAPRDKSEEDWKRS